jgi:hypothetical protein
METKMKHVNAPQDTIGVQIMNVHAKLALALVPAAIQE